MNCSRIDYFIHPSITLITLLTLPEPDIYLIFHVFSEESEDDDSDDSSEEEAPKKKGAEKRKNGTAAPVAAKKQKKGNKWQTKY